jgi:Cu/Ag efflux protein CusF
VGYENRAKGFNLKELAKTLMFLQDNGLTNYEDLKRATAAATTDFSEISQSIKVIDKRLSEINELHKNIGTAEKRGMSMLHIVHPATVRSTVPNTNLILLNN